MSSCLEFEAKAVDKAVEKASETLNIPIEKLQYKVISYGSTGIFGLVGVKKARICVTVPSHAKGKSGVAVVSPPPDPSSSSSVDPVSDRSRDRRGRSDRLPEPQPATERGTEQQVQGQQPASVAEIPDKSSDPASVLPADSSDVRSEMPAAGKIDAGGSEREERFEILSTPTSEYAAALVEEAFGLEKDAPDNIESDPARLDPATANVASEIHLDVESDALAVGKETLRRIIDFITEDADIEITAREDRILFNIEGGNAGVLIGKRGQTLEAIQYLVEKVVNRQSEKRIRIQIDVEGYLDNRRENLISLAHKLSEKAKSTGKPATIGQMNAHDRRIIHLALKNDQGVRTQSIGDGFYRKLVIFPKKRRKKQSV